MPHEVQVGALARVDADLARPGVGVAAGMLERGPRALQEDALLRVEVLGLARRIAEEAGVELVEALELDARLHIGGVVEQFLRNASGAQLLVGEAGHGLHAVADVAPESIDIVGARKAPRHADDGDLDAGGGRVGLPGLFVEGVHQLTLSADLRR